jgi:putative phosphoribosyl transferase
MPPSAGSARPSDSLPPAAAAPAPVRIWIGPIALQGDLTVFPGCAGIVIFAHGSGSRRRSPRNRSVARVLHQAGIGTLLFDLLTPEEDENNDDRFRFDLGLLAGRLVGATQWIRGRSPPAGGVGYFGSGMGAAAALAAAARLGPEVKAVVSRGGRPDLVAAELPRVTAPTLLIVGERDPEVLAANQSGARLLLRAPHELEVVPGATHLFEEEGSLEQVAALARSWFQRYLAPR